MFKNILTLFEVSASDSSISLVFCLGEFQGPALTVVLEGTSLTLEEVRTLQFLPPWKLRGTTLSYGLGILSCYCISHFLAVVSNGHFYIFDPIGKALSVPSSQGPAAKMFSLMGKFFF